MPNPIDSDAYRAAYQKGTDSVFDKESKGRAPGSTVGLLVIGALLGASLLLPPVEGSASPLPTATGPGLIEIDGQLCTGPYIHQHRGPYMCSGVPNTEEQGTLIQFNSDGTRYIEAPNGARINE